ncbi:AMP-binding protein [Nocardia pseudobrasiliensis]|uniref:AMP-binding enzyme n=1 Tax=Nocardia pseudobrasiliensis TaxID=45979 RepID=A0A370I740_9NOCA|nr:AMP-binding enzyme [Nocardia pseudobrasiliensis]
MRCCGSPAAFDVSAWELFWPLRIGATPALAEHGGFRDPAYLRRVIAEYGVGTVHFVPSMLEVFPLVSRVRSRDRGGRWLARGPACTTCTVTTADSTGVPIGAPVFKTRLYVLDSRLRSGPG